MIYYTEKRYRRELQVLYDFLGGGGWKFEEPKTPQSPRNIPLTQVTLNALRPHRKEQSEHLLKLGSAYQKHDLVFASELGTPFHWRNLRNRHFKKIVERRDCLRPSGFTTFVTRAPLYCCLPVRIQKSVSERLGHEA
jgi:integrase